MSPAAPSAAHALANWGRIVTTFADREHAIEAHYAQLELAAFRERAHRHKRLGFHFAVRLNLHGAEGRLFARKLSERCVEEPSDENLYHLLADELGRRGLAMSEAGVRHMALSSGADRSATITPLPGQSWIEFVTTELLSLFGDGGHQTLSLPEQPDSISAV